MKVIKGGRQRQQGITCVENTIFQAGGNNANPVEFVIIWAESIELGSDQSILIALPKLKI